MPFVVFRYALMMFSPSFIPEQYEEEKKAFLAKLEDYTVPHSRLQDLERDVRSREDQIELLQSQLSEANQLLYDTRQRAQKLQHENDSLRVSEVESRRKIADLLSLCEPVTEDVTYFRDCRPEKSRRFFVASNSGVAKDAGGTSKGVLLGDTMRQTGKSPVRTRGSRGRGSLRVRRRRVAPGSGKSKKGASGASRVLRTVFLPNENVDALVLQIEALRTQLEEQQQLFEERRAAEKVETSVREREALEARQRDRDSILRLHEDLKKTQSRLHDTTRDLFALSHNTDVKLRKGAERRALLEQQCAVLRKQTELLKERFREESHAIMRETRSQAEHLVEKFRSQAITSENDVLLLQEKNQDTRRKAAREVSDLKSQVSRWKARYRALENRRAFDLEGFRSEVVQLRQELDRVRKKAAELFEWVRESHDEAKLDLEEEIAAETLGIKTGINRLARRLREANQRRKKTGRILYS